MNAVQMSEKYTLDELVHMEREASLQGKRKKVDTIMWAITYKLAELREQRGDPVAQDGYTGRKSNMR